MCIHIHPLIVTQSFTSARAHDLVDVPSATHGVHNLLHALPNAFRPGVNLRRCRQHDALQSRPSRAPHTCHAGRVKLQRVAHHRRSHRFRDAGHCFALCVEILCTAAAGLRTTRRNCSHIPRRACWWEGFEVAVSLDACRKSFSYLAGALRPSASLSARGNLLAPNLYGNCGQLAWSSRPLISTS